MNSAVEALYGKKVRVRACGVCWRENDLLMVNHRGLTQGDFWAPPGGGVGFGEAVEDRLRREFMEETGLLVTPGRLLFVCELIRNPFHSIELFFEIAAWEGEARTGHDPELDIITDVRFMSPEDIMRLPESNRHGIFRLIASPDELKTLTGFFRI